MVIQHNTAAANAAGQVQTGMNRSAKSGERLSSGYRINRAADDAAGLSVSEKMRWQIRGLGKASSNAEDGISYIQTAEGALDEMHAMMNRCKELCVQAANDTNTQADRSAIQAELDRLTEEVDRIASTTQYNTMDVFSTGGTNPYAVMGASSLVNEISVTYDFIDASGNVLTPGGGHGNTATGYTGNQKTIADYVAAQAAIAAGAILAAYPSLGSASSSGLKVGLQLATMDGAGGTLASAALSMRWSNAQTEMTYTLNVDTSDYNITNYNDGSLAATLAHEMTHLIMQDTLTSGMIGKNSEPYPLWFVEGMAQTASGDDGWFSYNLNSSSTNAQIQNYLSQTASMPYGAGYLSTLYLAQMASGASVVTTASLRSGVDTILQKLIAGDTLSQVINQISGGTYTDYTDFQSRVSADMNAVQFTKDFIAARGTNGAGSVIANNLTTKTEDILVGKGSYTTSYTVDTTTTAYTNIFGSGFTFPDNGTASGTGGGGSGSGGVNNGGGLMLQVGSLSGQAIALTTFDASSNALYRGTRLNAMSHNAASASIKTVDDASEAISRMRSYYGAMQNRLEHVIANVDNTGENTQAAESRIRDTDMAEEMVAYSGANIVSQAAQAMLAQANQSKNAILRLLEA